jgi:hypothetical protein
MGEVRPIPTLGGVVRDVRGRGRALRVSWHSEDGIVVLSLWDGPRCTGTVRVAAHDVPPLVEALQVGLLEPPGEPIAPPPVEAAESSGPPGGTGQHGRGPQHGLDIIDTGPEDGVAG